MVRRRVEQPFDRSELGHMPRVLDELIQVVEDDQPDEHLERHDQRQGERPEPAQDAAEQRLSQRGSEVEVFRGVVALVHRPQEVDLVMVPVAPVAAEVVGEQPDDPRPPRIDGERFGRRLRRHPQKRRHEQRFGEQIGDLEHHAVAHIHDRFTDSVSVSLAGPAVECLANDEKDEKAIAHAEIVQFSHFVACAGAKRS